MHNPSGLIFSALCSTLHNPSPLPPPSSLPHHVFPVVQVDLSEEGTEGCWRRDSQVICQTRTNRSEEVGMLLSAFISFCKKKKRRRRNRKSPSSPPLFFTSKPQKKNIFAGCNPVRCVGGVLCCAGMEGVSSFSSSASRSSSAEPLIYVSCHATLSASVTILPASAGGSPAAGTERNQRETLCCLRKYDKTK